MLPFPLGKPLLHVKVILMIKTKTIAKGKCFGSPARQRVFSGIVIIYRPYCLLYFAYKHLTCNSYSAREGGCRGRLAWVENQNFNTILMIKCCLFAYFIKSNCNPFKINVYMTKLNKHLEKRKFRQANSFAKMNSSWSKIIVYYGKISNFFPSKKQTLLLTCGEKTKILTTI